MKSIKHIPRDKRASPLVEEALLIVLGLLCILLLLGMITGMLEAVMLPFKWLFP